MRPQTTNIYYFDIVINETINSKKLQNFASSITFIPATFLKSLIKMYKYPRLIDIENNWDTVFQWKSLLTKTMTNEDI